MDYPKVTIIVPCHNHEKWIEGALDSIANQDYPNFQIVVVENGSNDRSPRKISSLVSKLQKTTNEFSIGKYKDYDIDIAFSCINEAKGPSWARNQGIRFSHPFTDLFAFLDSDDIYEQGKLSKSVALWMKYPRQVGVVYSDYDTLGEDGVRIREFKEPFNRIRLTQDCIINCDSLVSKAAFDTHGLFDETLRVCEDYDMWMRITDTFLAMHIPESLVTIRTGSHSSTSLVKEKTWNECRYKVFEKAHKRFGGDFVHR